ncbi:hypothetical protein HI914_06417 [Erysiphe necator]|uniref:Putative \x09 ubiquinol cytochrome-c reductase assembly protein cbp3 n=1 Tax=Uncinula necator TaxID=52586 RepID=A0A0B1P7P5_UNCNE|nr:hypothetical protein HI914_06417 [Erysiphe necator]KHJ34263.1 putative \x09 ubiquinol cytochrome-c reductase assembly protein cbp3 [Erysiphe necator]
MGSRVWGYSPTKLVESVFPGKKIFSLCRSNEICSRHSSINIICRTFRASTRCITNTKSTSSFDTLLTSKHEHSNHLQSKSVKENSGSALKKIQRVIGNASSPYTVHGAAEVLFKECARHAAYNTPLVGTDEEIPTTEDGEEIGVADEKASWHKEFGFPATFSTWSQVTMLHMYLYTVRIRNAPPDQVKIWQRCIQDQFFYAAEDRMVVNHNMSAGVIRSKYLKDLYVQWRGLIAAYDEGLAKGDAVLAAAIWRNIYKAREDFDIRDLAQIVSYVRHSLQKLENLLSITDLVDFEFNSLSSEKAAVLAPSQQLKVPFVKAPS